MDKFLSCCHIYQFCTILTLFVVAAIGPFMYIARDLGSISVISQSDPCRTCIREAAAERNLRSKQSLLILYPADWNVGPCQYGRDLTLKYVLTFLTMLLVEPIIRHCFVRVCRKMLIFFFPAPKSKKSRTEERCIASPWSRQSFHDPSLGKDQF